jgi:hypothetical protein
MWNLDLKGKKGHEHKWGTIGRTTGGWLRGREDKGKENIIEVHCIHA